MRGATAIASKHGVTTCVLVFGSYPVGKIDEKQSVGVYI